MAFFSNILRHAKKMVLVLLLILFVWEAEAMNDTIRTAEIPQGTLKQNSPIPFSYKNVRDYIFSHLSYPAEAVKAEIEGTVDIRFILTETGRIDSVKVLNSVHPLLDAEALRLIRDMPLWKPVYLHGKPVSLIYEVPVIFELIPAEMEMDSLKHCRQKER